jgi:hypothetical protein
MEFTWHDVWEPIFDAQIDTIKEDIARARGEERLVAYLSCPISPRGGGFSETNVEISQYTGLQLQQRLGYGLWILNPTSYQLESKAGRALLRAHAERHGVTIDEIPSPNGGDYMRMWTKILVEDGQDNLGEYFDMYYFLGPSDVREFFVRGGTATVTAAVEDYFSRKIVSDLEFKRHFTPPFHNRDGTVIPSDNEDQEWQRRRREFQRFYSLRAGAAYSKGCHDEWNIGVLLNQMRAGIGSQIAGFFDGTQIELGSVNTETTKGYAR